MPSAFSASWRLRKKLLASRNSSKAPERRINRVRIDSRAMVPVLAPLRSAEQGDADDAAEVTHLLSLFRITGNVHFPFGRAVASQTGLPVIFGDRDAVGRAAVNRDIGGKGLALRPIRREQFGLDHIAFPS